MSKTRKQLWDENAEYRIRCDKLTAALRKLTSAVEMAEALRDGCTDFEAHFDVVVEYASKAEALLAEDESQ